jgi:hypothetical protein
MGRDCVRLYGGIGEAARVVLPPQAGLRGCSGLVHSRWGVGLWRQWLRSASSHPCSGELSAPCWRPGSAP